jgi:diguanylate cyclase (GGDEF)-like protein
VLIADDEEDARLALAEVLAPECDVLTAADGEEAVRLTRLEHPDLVLMDLYMPRVDGFQALQRIRSDGATGDVPVIFVSARGDDTVKARALDSGAVDYLQKPFSERELRARVERTLRLSRSQSALRELAQTDPLTGLANLRAFRMRLADEVKRARRYRNPLTCVMADMDHLKPINDELGHSAGDRAIAAVATVIRAELRETDFGARYGGDEFVLLLPHTAGDEGRILAERVCARLRETALEVSGRSVPLGASFGVACLVHDAPDAADALVRAADAALYRAKHAGRGCVEVSFEEDSGDAAGATPN